MDSLLVAQEQAYWAACSALAAWVLGCLTLVVNGAGLYFIWGQLKANREALATASLSATAAAEAAKVAFLTGRPWIRFSVSRAFLNLPSDDPTVIGCQIDYEMENIGQTPAVQVEVVWRPVAITNATRDRLAEEFRSLLATKPKHPRPLFPGENVAEGISTNFPFPQMEDERGMYVCVIAAVLYKAHATGETYFTPLALGLQQKVPPPDRVYRFFRGMGHNEFLVMPMRDETPDPT